MVAEFTAGWVRKYVDRRAMAQVYGHILNQHFNGLLVISSIKDLKNCSK
jgi:hypothetical protein